MVIEDSDLTNRFSGRPIVPSLSLELDVADCDASVSELPSAATRTKGAAVKGEWRRDRAASPVSIVALGYGDNALTCDSAS
jgi:hypothetical protein